MNPSLLILGVLASPDLAVAELGHVGVGQRRLQPEGTLNELRLGDDLPQADCRLRLCRLLLLLLLGQVFNRISFWLEFWQEKSPLLWQVHCISMRELLEETQKPQLKKKKHAV